MAVRARPAQKKTVSAPWLHYPNLDNDETGTLYHEEAKRHENFEYEVLPGTPLCDALEEINVHLSSLGLHALPRRHLHNVLKKLRAALIAAGALADALADGSDDEAQAAFARFLEVAGQVPQSDYVRTAPVHAALAEIIDITGASGLYSKRLRTKAAAIRAILDSVCPLVPMRGPDASHQNHSSTSPANCPPKPKFRKGEAMPLLEAALPKHHQWDGARSVLNTTPISYSELSALATPANRVPIGDPAIQRFFKRHFGSYDIYFNSCKRPEDLAAKMAVMRDGLGAALTFDAQRGVPGESMDDAGDDE